jgi:predicted ArsR family transcriptional regulator
VTPAGAGAGPAAVHRALSSPTRARLLSLVREAGAPAAVDELAEWTGLHPNTVRAHLGVLEEAGLVRSAPESRDRPGRPRLVYEAVEGEDVDAFDRPGYRFLAQMLAGHIATTSADPASEAIELGAAWGRHLTPAPPPSRRTPPDEVVERLRSLLHDLGFDPELEATPDEPPRLLLRRCPFLRVAEEHQEVVCSIHLGLMRGATRQLGGAVEVTDLIPFAEPAGCVSHLALEGIARSTS